jgi:hypothetical protein
MILTMVWLEGFEPSLFGSQSRRTTGLSYSQILSNREKPDKPLRNFLLNQSHEFSFYQGRFSLDVFCLLSSHRSGCPLVACCSEENLTTVPIGNMLKIYFVNQTAVTARHLVSGSYWPNPFIVLCVVIFHYSTNSYRKMADPAD